MFESLNELEKNDNHNFSKIYMELKKKEKETKSSDYINEKFTYILIGFYSFILMILLYILWRITHMKKVEDPFWIIWFLIKKFLIK